MKHISEIIKQIKDKKPKWIGREQKFLIKIINEYYKNQEEFYKNQDRQLEILFKKTIPNYYNNKYKTK